MVLVRAVGEVEARHAHTRLEHHLELGDVARDGAEGADDVRLLLEDAGVQVWVVVLAVGALGQGSQPLGDGDGGRERHAFNSLLLHLLLRMCAAYSLVRPRRA